ncbi:O-antigen ligase family protein [Hydrogenophaga sp.]|uniref:O-antigen ligase family protein n=1 Tax=Hydrogenophaga sp. TaxID=1904254 RepID=UPI003F6A7FFA
MTSHLKHGTSLGTGLIQAVCGWSAVALVFAAPVSRSLFLVAGLLFVLSWLSEGNHRAKWQLLRENPITTPVLALSAVVLVWSLFSPAPSIAVLHTLKVYSKLPLILMLITTFSDERWRQRAWLAFIAAMVLVVLSTYANVVIDLPWSRTQNQGLGQDHSVFIEHVSQSLMTAMFVAVCVHRAINCQTQKQRYLWITLALLALISMVFLVQARSGLVALIVASAVLLFMHIPRQKLVWVGGAAMLMSSLLIVTSPLMRDRIVLAYSEVVNYKPFELTSLGARIDMWRFALDQSIEHPFTGTGAGTYRDLAAQHFGHCTWVCEHPHNQYLFFSMEYGLLGLAAFLWFLWRVFVSAYKSLRPERTLLMVFLAILMIDSLFNVPLWFRGQSYFFFAMLALLLASARPPPSANTAQLN